jgi:hypothetical protein
MSRTFLTLLVAAAPALLGAQVTTVGERQSLPREVRREVIDRWNGANATALRTSARLEITPQQQVRGDVLVRNGPLIIAGHVSGNVLAMNSDVTIAPTARLDGDLLVIGGEVTGLNTARISGRTRIFRQSLVYREDGDHIVGIADDGSDDITWWRRLEPHREGNWSDVLRVVQAGPYNRVEGLPIQLGPAIHRLTPWGSIRVDAAAVVRTGSSFGSEGSDIGDNLRAEVRVGRGRGIGVGGSAFNVVDAVESWQLSDLETALAAFVSRRDYRDYYQRHGGNAFVTLYGARDLSLTGSFGEERWSTRVLRNPFTLFNSDDPWRPNPQVDEGLFHIATTSLKFDTRTDPDDPWSGWYLNADFEYGRGRITATPLAVGTRSRALNDVTSYTRGFFDFRRYNRLGPSSQVNMRVVLGGWIDGDPLPIERRMSVDGPGTLPGYDFRSARAGPDVGACNVGASILARPALCDRIALAQIEYRRDLRLDITSLWQDWPHHYRSSHGDVAWVLFADAGRGWIVDNSLNGSVPGLNVRDPLIYGSGEFPSLSTFRSDVGLGLDFGGIGIYGAKAIVASEPMNFFFRLRHRF